MIQRSPRTPAQKQHRRTLARLGRNVDVGDGLDRLEAYFEAYAHRARDEVAPARIEEPRRFAWFWKMLERP